MAHSLSTPNKALPKFADTDKPTWTGDWNELVTKVDAEFGRLQGLIDALQTQVNNKVDKP